MNFAVHSVIYSSTAFDVFFLCSIFREDWESCGTSHLNKTCSAVTFRFIFIDSQRAARRRKQPEWGKRLEVPRWRCSEMQVRRRWHASDHHTLIKRRAARAPRAPPALHLNLTQNVSDFYWNAAQFQGYGYGCVSASVSVRCACYLWAARAFVTFMLDLLTLFYGRLIGH